VVRHAGSAALGRVSDAAVFYGQRNLEWAWIKNTPASLWWRSLPAHVLYDLAGGVAYARRGQLWPWLRGKTAAVMGAPHVWRKRALVQRHTRVSAGALRSVMDRRWWAVKTAEKKFDFVEFTRGMKG